VFRRITAVDFDLESNLVVAHKWATLLLPATDSLENGFNKLGLKWIILLLLAWQMPIRNQIRLDDYKQKHMISNAAVVIFEEWSGLHKKSEITRAKQKKEKSEITFY
jgi:hypothetical protein